MVAGRPGRTFLGMARARLPAVLAALLAGLSATAAAQVPSPATGLLPDGRRLTPSGAQVALGNYPTGGAVTADGRFLWTVSTGISSNDVRIVDTATRRVIQKIAVPGASGGVALDTGHRRAYVSGLANSRWQPEKAGLPGARGDVVLAYRWSSTTGRARLDRVIHVPAPAGAPTVQAFPPPRAGLAGTTQGWPQKLAVSPGGGRLLVSLNLADHAAIVDLYAEDRVRYVRAGSYPYGAAIQPAEHGRIGLVTNEASGTVSVVDLRSGTPVKTITVGPPLSHPEGIVVDPSGTRAYVALEASDQVVVIDLRHRRVERTISVGRSAGLGTMPVAVALSPDGTRLFVAESGADEIAVIRLPDRAPGRAPAATWEVIGRLPTADQPQAVATAAAHGSRPAQLLWVAAEGVGIGPNPKGTNPTQAEDPIFWAFNPTAPTFDIFAGVQYPAKMVRGRAGLLTLPSDRAVRRATPAASRQLQPVPVQRAPAGTPVRPGGPIKHVFFIVRENRAYDQLLGDVSRGNGDPKLTVFGKAITPNLHALVSRFPLLDNVYANSEASIQGHYWTAAASVPDYVSRNWVQQYAARGRPNDFGVYAVSWPGNGFLFDEAERRHISYFNYGEGFGAAAATVPDRDRSPAQLRRMQRIAANSDLGPPITPDGCFASDLLIGTALDGRQIFDSSLPAGVSPKTATSHVDCFRQRFARQLAANAVPTFSYLTLTSDHTRGTEPGYPTPRAMVADSDQAVGELLDTISHSPVWSSSAVFVVEDDSQDGADHVDAHRIPVLVASPYARRGAVLHTRYDLVSVARTMELIMGMRPLSLNDALAAPMYDVFAPTRVNPEPVTGIRSTVDLLSANTPGAPWASMSRRLTLERPDSVSQAVLDRIIWASVHGAGSAPPPPGPGASGRDEDDES